MFHYEIKNNRRIGIVDAFFDTDDVNVCFEKAYQILGNTLKINGFRKNKIPKKLVMLKTGIANVKQKAVEIAIQNVVSAFGNDDEIVAVNMLEDTFTEGTESTVKFQVVYGFYAKLCDYNIPLIKKETISISKEELDKLVYELRSKHREVRFTDDGAKTGDVVIVDFDAKIDGKNFIGGSGRDAILEVGECDFFPELNTVLIGKKEKDEFEFSAVINGSRYGEAFIGKNALYRFRVKKVKRSILPNFTDDFIKKHTRFSSVKDFLDDYEKNRLREEENKFTSYAISKAMNYIASNSDVEIDENLIENQRQEILSAHSKFLKLEGNCQEYFLRQNDMDEMSFDFYVNNLAKNLVIEKYLVNMIAKKESITANDFDDLKDQVFKLLLTKMVY